MKIATYKKYEIHPTLTDDESLLRMVNFFKKSFPASAQLTLDFLKWQYAGNPDGKVVGFNAYFNDHIVAHYVIIPARALIRGKEAKGFLSLNTATHPEHYNQGLFTELARRTYSLAAEMGGEYVLGVGNLNSTHGLIHKLGFKFVSKLNTKIILAGNPIPRNDIDWEFQTLWNEERLKWRLSGPNKPYQLIETNNLIYCYAKTKKDKYKSLIGIFDKRVNIDPTGNVFNKRKIRTYVGLENCLNWKNTISINVPDFLRFTPLNLTIKDLKGNNTFSADRFNFYSIDFDGY